MGGPDQRPGDGRNLRPPSATTPLDRAWRRRQWRLQSAHDDFGLHAGLGDPRTAIHRASGLVRLHRKALRERLRACRRIAAAKGKGSDEAIRARRGVTPALKDYRLAVSTLADSVADFETRNAQPHHSMIGRPDSRVMQPAEESRQDP